MDMVTRLKAIEDQIDKMREQLAELSSRTEDDVTSAAKKTARFHELIGQSIYQAIHAGHIPARNVYEILDNFLWNDDERVLFGLKIFGDSPLRESRKPVVPIWGQNQFGRSN